MVNKVIPYCNLWPGPQSIIVIDNTPIHKAEVPWRVWFIPNNGAFKNYTVRLEFSPPYSPDFKEVFAKLKAWMRKNYKLQDKYALFELFLEAGVRHMCLKTGNHFHSTPIAEK